MAIYFTVEEMTKSQKAKLYHIDNTPTDIVTGKQIGRAHV